MIIIIFVHLVSMDKFFDFLDFLLEEHVCVVKDFKDQEKFIFSFSVPLLQCLRVLLKFFSPGPTALSQYGRCGVQFTVNLFELCSEGVLPGIVGVLEVPRTTGYTLYFIAA